MLQPGHHSRRDATSDWKRHHPGKDDVAEDRPVNVIARAESANEHDGANFAVSGADWNTNVAGNQNCHGRTNLNAETTRTETLFVNNIYIYFNYVR